MVFKKTALPGVFLIELQSHADSRGFFARSFCQREFEEAGLNPRVAQCNLSYNAKRGTLRGMHLQEAPFQEAKLVRCTSGAIYDVVIDLREGSPTFLRHFGARLDAKNRGALYIAEGLAHGFLTLEDETEVHYQMSEFHHPESARGFRWNDPAFGIRWPMEPLVISERDSAYPDFRVEK